MAGPPKRYEGGKGPRYVDVDAACRELLAVMPGGDADDARRDAVLTRERGPLFGEERHESARDVSESNENQIEPRHCGVRIEDCGFIGD